MFYDASMSPHPADSGFSCLSVATATTITSAHPVFTDTSRGRFTVGRAACSTRARSSTRERVTPTCYGSPTTAALTEASQVWSVRLSPTGRRSPGRRPCSLQSTPPSFPWETTTDDPDLVYDAGTYRLLFSVGNFAVVELCRGAHRLLGPVRPLQPAVERPVPRVLRFGRRARRRLAVHRRERHMVDRLRRMDQRLHQLLVRRRAQAVRSSDPIRPEHRGPVQAARRAPVGLPAGRHRRRHIHLREPSILRVDGFDRAEPAGRGNLVHSRRRRVLDGGERRWHLRLRRRRLSRLDGWKALERADRRDGGHPRRMGYWLVASDGGIFSFGNAKFHGSTGHMHLNQPIVGMSATRGRQAGTGSSLPTAASSASATPSTMARPGRMHLNRPVVGMATDTATGGYWLVASDGGIFAYDAPFRGSMGGKPPQPTYRRHPGAGRRYGLPDGRLRRRDLQLQGSLLRLDGRTTTQQAGRGDQRVLRTASERPDSAAVDRSLAPDPGGCTCARTRCLPLVRRRRRARRMVDGAEQLLGRDHGPRRLRLGLRRHAARHDRRAPDDRDAPGDLLVGDGSPGARPA